jgi:hypothetical protein
VELQTGVYMPRYFIDVRSRFGCDEDLEGIYLPSTRGAGVEALKVATLKLGDKWQDLPSEAKRAIAIEVVGEAGQTVLVVPFWEIERHLQAAPLSESQRPIRPIAGRSISASTLLSGALLLAGTVTALAVALV